MRIILLGSSGMLGQALYDELINDFILLCIDKVDIGHSNFKKIDVNNVVNLTDTISDFNPDVIINCVAIVNLTECENKPEKAHYIHYELPVLLAQTGIYIILISTDSIFDGQHGSYTEDSIPCPLNEYARTKQKGEAPILNVGGLVIRTNIYGFNKEVQGHSLLEWGIGAISQKQKISGYGDVYFNPVSIWQLSSIIKVILLMESSVKGVINIASEQRVSKYQFLKMMNQLLDGSETLIAEDVMLDGNVLRPKNTTLETKKLNSFGVKTPQLLYGLKDAIARYKSSGGG